jgi:hypothetical protein
MLSSRANAMFRSNGQSSWVRRKASGSFCGCVEIFIVGATTAQLHLPIPMPAPIVSPIFVSRAQAVREYFLSVLSCGTLVLSFIHLKGSSMGSKWFTGGVVAAGRGRIRFDFILDGIRYRPTIKRPPSEANCVEPESGSR